MEYILITAFSLLVAIPLVIIFFQYNRSYNNEITMNQANKVMDEIFNAAETVHYLGEPSQKTITVYFPNNIQEINFTDGYFTFTLNAGSYSYTIYRASEINFTGNISTSYGLHTFKIAAINNTVNIATTSQ